MLLALALLTTWKIPDPPAVYSGRAGQVEVRIPRLEADLSVDGKLTEAVWGESAVMTGFSQFSPTDGIPAADTTQVLVWYSPTAIHFGVRAFEAHGPVHATLADRDKISADDYIQILLSTFKDQRLAAVVEGAEQDLDVIVRRDLIPIRQGGVHRSMRLEGAHAEVDRSGRVPDEDLGRVGGRDSIRGRELGEAGHHRRLAPDGLRQLPVHRQVGLQPGNPYFHLPRPAAVHGRRIGNFPGGEEG